MSRNGLQEKGCRRAWALTCREAALRRVSGTWYFRWRPVKVRGGYEEVAKTYLEVYFGSQRRALAVVILLAICSGEGGAVLAREEDEVDGAC